MNFSSADSHRGFRPIDIRDVTPERCGSIKKIDRDENCERLIRPPQTRLVEETIEGAVKLRERVVEIAKHHTQDAVIAVPEIEYYETQVELPDPQHYETIKQVRRVDVQSEVTKVPKHFIVEKIVEVPEIEYREVLVERIVEVPEYRDEVVIKEIPMNEYIEIPVHQDKIVNVPQTFDRNLPIPVEVISEWRFKLPNIKTKRRYEKVNIYVPRFIEVPVPSAYLNDAEFAEAKSLYEVVQRITANTCPSLAEIEKLAEVAKKHEHLIREPDSTTTNEEVEIKLREHLESVQKTEQFL